MTAARRPLHIVICNERLLPRFGVDRLLLLLGAGLRERGHRITFVCQRGDAEVIRLISPALHLLPELGQMDLHAAEHTAVAWLREHWAALNPDGGPAILVSGGWPFFGVAELGAELGVPSLFIDAGAVPHDGMIEVAAHIQRELRRLRARALPRFSRVLPISGFIRDTQTLPDRGSVAGVETVLLGADHLDSPMFPPAAGGEADAQALARLDALLAEGGRPILLLGRFEAEGYKNSPAAFQVLAGILEQEPGARLLVLAGEEEIAPPEAVRNAVLPLGFVSDAALDAIMARCELGLSLSLWEGFNLPLAEMQWRGRPVLAFNLGAHPEVVADPWMLCGSLAEMTDKALALLRHGLPAHVVAEDRFGAFRARFRWDDVIGRYAEVIEAMAERGGVPAPARPAEPIRVVLVDCSCAARDPANPGVIRVVRRACQALQQDPELLLVFALWDPALGRYRFLAEEEQRRLASYDGPGDGFSRLFSAPAQGYGWQVENVLALLPGAAAAAPPVLFLPEVVLDGYFPERLVWAAANGLRTAAILYDLIPVTHMPFCAATVVQRFGEYLEALACVDGLWAISGESLHQFERYADRHRLPLPPEREAIWLPGQFAAEPRNAAAIAAVPPAPEDSLLVLCVGSIEPRKNHRTLIEAFRALLRRRPDLPLKLVLVGHRFAGADDLATWLDAVTQEEPRITWTGLLPDAEVGALYRRAAFTVYPSLVEGFGLPVMESLWMGCPCLCHSGGVMAELAAEGGCLRTDMSDPAAIEHAIERLAEDAGLRRRLAQEAAAREISDWQDYAAKIAARLKALARPGGTPPQAAAPGAAGSEAAAAREAARERIRAAALALRGRSDRHVQVLDLAVGEAREP